MRTIEEVCSELRRKTDLLSHHKSKQYEVTCKACDEIIEIAKKREDQLRDEIVDSIIAELFEDKRIGRSSFNAVLEIVEKHATK